MEGLILMADVVLMVYLCWRIFRCDEHDDKDGGLGWLAYRKDDEP